MLIAFSGLKGSGKDTAASVLINEYGFKKIAFADAVRDLALVIDPIVSFNQVEGGIRRLSDIVDSYGWDVAKRQFPEVRRLLQRIGTEGGRNFFNEDIWIEILDKDFPDLSFPETRYVVTDCRFDNEVNFVHDKLGDIYWIERPGLVSDGHESESTEIKDKADYILSNDTTIDELHEDIRLSMFMKGIDPIDTGTTRQAS